jgi:hypothetical protein
MQDVFITTLLSSHLNILAGPSQSWILIFKSDQYIPSILDYKTFQLSRYIPFSIGPMEKKLGGDVHTLQRHRESLPWIYDTAIRKHLMTGTIT